MDPFVGEIRLFSWNWAPRGWLPCDGRELNIQQNVALYSLLSTTYGGNGTTTFCLPDLRVRTPIGFDPAHPPVPTSKRQDGSATKTLPVAVIPAHSHQARASTEAATATAPAGGIPAISPKKVYHAAPVAPAKPVALRSDTVGFAGSGQPMDNTQPSIGSAFFIAPTGNYPPQD